MARTGRARRRWIALGVSVGGLAVLVGAGIAAAGWYRAGLVEAARERGLMVYCCPTALAGRVIQCVMLAPPLNIAAHDVDEILDRLEPAIGAA